MKSYDKLHLLIKSLSKNEKRFFSINGSIHTLGEQNTYMKLFELIDAQNEYNETAIIKAFNGSMTKKNLATRKHYLFNKIISSLRQVLDEKKISLKIKKLMDFAEILLDRNFFEEAENKLLEAEKLCIESGNSKLLLQIYELLLTCTSFYKDAKKKKIQITKIELLKTNYLQDISFEEAILKCYNTLRIELSSKNKQFELPNLNLPTTLKGKLYFYLLQLDYNFYLKKNYTASFNALNAIYSLFNKHKLLKLENHHMDTRLLFIRLGLSMETLNYKEGLNTIASIKLLKKKHHSYALSIDIELLRFYILFGLRTEALEMFDHINANTGVYSDGIYPEKALEIKYLHTLLLFYNGEYNKAKIALLELKCDPGSIHYSRKLVLQCCIILSTKNLIELALIERKLIRYKNQISPNVISLLRLLIKQFHLFEKPLNIQMAVQEQFKTLNPAEFRHLLIYHFNILAWLKSLATKKTTFEIISENTGNYSSWSANCV
jgi:hypothetical protein